MLQVVQSKCPCCVKWVNYLEPAMEIDGKVFHICKDCSIKILGVHDYVRIAFHYGRESFRKELKEFLDGKLEIGQPCSPPTLYG